MVHITYTKPTLVDIFRIVSLPPLTLLVLVPGVFLEVAAHERATQQGPVSLVLVLRACHVTTHLVAPRIFPAYCRVLLINMSIFWECLFDSWLLAVSFSLIFQKKSAEQCNLRGRHQEIPSAYSWKVPKPSTFWYFHCFFAINGTLWSTLFCKITCSKWILLSLGLIWNFGACFAITWKSHCSTGTW